MVVNRDFLYNESIRRSFAEDITSEAERILMDFYLVGNMHERCAIKKREYVIAYVLIYMFLYQIEPIYL